MLSVEGNAGRYKTNCRFLRCSEFPLALENVENNKLGSGNVLKFDKIRKCPGKNPIRIKGQPINIMLSIVEEKRVLVHGLDIPC